MRFFVIVFAVASLILLMNHTEAKPFPGDGDVQDATKDAVKNTIDLIGNGFKKIGKSKRSDFECRLCLKNSPYETKELQDMVLQEHKTVKSKRGITGIAEKVVEGAAGAVIDKAADGIKKGVEATKSN